MDAGEHAPGAGAGPGAGMGGRGAGADAGADAGVDVGERAEGNTGVGAGDGSGNGAVITAFEAAFELAEMIGRLSRGPLAERGLSGAKAEVLLRLGQHGAQVQRALSELLLCTPRHVTGLVDALEEADLVRRKPHPTDRRATLVELTEAGEQMVQWMTSGRERGAVRLFGDVPEADLAIFNAVLRRALDRLQADLSQGAERST